MLVTPQSAWLYCFCFFIAPKKWMSLFNRLEIQIGVFSIYGFIKLTYLGSLEIHASTHISAKLKTRTFMNKSLTLPVEMNTRCSLFCDKESLFLHNSFTVLCCDQKNCIFLQYLNFFYFRHVISVLQKCWHSNEPVLEVSVQ